MEVVGHQGVGRNADVALLAALFEEFEEVLAIGVAEEDALLVVAALGDVQPESGRGESVFAGQFGPPMISGFRRLKFSIILTEKCGGVRVRHIFGGGLRFRRKWLGEYSGCPAMPSIADMMA
jgi:hypothetical protein